jgi:hypothetical protein
MKHGGWGVALAAALFGDAAVAQPSPPIRSSPRRTEVQFSALDEQPDADDPWNIPYAEGDPIPDGYRVTRSFNGGVFAAGLAVFAFSYGLSLVVAASESEGRHDALYAPLIGPWVTLGTDDGRPGGEIGLFVAAGLFQASGMGLIALGLGRERLWLVKVAPQGATLSTSF